jgi:hypothetical protein
LGTCRNSLRFQARVLGKDHRMRGGKFAEERFRRGDDDRGITSITLDKLKLLVGCVAAIVPAPSGGGGKKCLLGS